MIPFATSLLVAALSGSSAIPEERLPADQCIDLAGHGVAADQRLVAVASNDASTGTDYGFYKAVRARDGDTTWYVFSHRRVSDAYRVFALNDGDADFARTFRYHSLHYPCAR